MTRYWQPIARDMPMTTTSFQSVAATRREAVSLRDKVDALRQPRTYPERTHSVGAIETHMSGRLGSFASRP
jgi:hypothetical protein